MVYAFGGLQNYETIDSIEKLDVNQNFWTIL